MPLGYTSAATTTGTTKVIWANWVTASNTITTSASTDTIWRIWSDSTNTTASITTTAATDTIWPIWVNQSIQTIRPVGAPISPQVAAEAAAERARRDEAYRAQRAEEDRKRALADERARQLLVSVLSDQQKKDLANNGYFFVDAPSGRRYRIDKGRSGNVKVIDKVTGVWTESLCIHQRDDVPVYDTMVMQKLLIETAEDEFRKVANITHKAGGYSYGQGILDGERLAQVLPFRPREQQAAA